MYSQHCKDDASAVSTNCSFTFLLIKMWHTCTTNAVHNKLIYLFCNNSQWNLLGIVFVLFLNLRTVCNLLYTSNLQISSAYSAEILFYCFLWFLWVWWFTVVCRVIQVHYLPGGLISWSKADQQVISISLLFLIVWMSLHHVLLDCVLKLTDQ